MKKNIILIVFALLLFGGCKKDKDVHVVRVQAETPDVTTTANAADISGTYSYASTLKSVVIVYGKDESLSSPQKVTAEHTRDSYSVRINNLDPSTKYYYYCIFDTGYGASESEQDSFTTQSGGGGGGGGTGDHEYVDLGLPSGLLWATCNVGASRPEGYGDYFAWGETEPKTIYDISTYKWCNGSETSYTKYNTDSNSGIVDNKTVLELEDDAAHVNWGGDWRMPTYDEMWELFDNCTWTWMTQNGKKGYRVTGPNGKSIFLPAAGYYNSDSLYYAGSLGTYWSSLLSTDDPCNAYYLYFSNENVNTNLYCGRCYGLSVRPVCCSQSVSVPTVITSSVSNITQTTATCGGNVTSDGGTTVTARGVCWSTSQNPTVSDSHTTDGTGTGSFTSNITGLTANTTYYVRAYATNSAGTSYGEQRSFTTLENGGGGGGRFSVSPTTMVEFAPGNLYWDGSAFRFEADQWSFADTWNASHVSHFFWSKTASVAYASSYSYSGASTGDVFFTEASGFQVSGETEGGTWRTLSAGEWSYLLNTSGASSGARTDVNRFAKAMVNGVKGLLIFPDGYNGTAMSGITGIATVNSTGAPYPSESIPTGTWASMESAGVVFLPAAGNRNGTSLYSVGSYGGYWSSTCNNSIYAYYLLFGSGNVSPRDDGSRSRGDLVRLVR